MSTVTAMLLLFIASIAIKLWQAAEAIRQERNRKGERRT